MVDQCPNGAFDRREAQVTMSRASAPSVKVESPTSNISQGERSVWSYERGKELIGRCAVWSHLGMIKTTVPAGSAGLQGAVMIGIRDVGITDNARGMGNVLGGRQSAP